MKVHTPLSVLLSLLFIACAQAPRHPELTSSPLREPSADRLAPHVPSNQEDLQRTCAQGFEQAPKEIMLSYRAFTSSYNPRYRIPNYVRNELYREGLEQSCAKRSNKFIPDNRLQSDFQIKPVVTKDYAGTGFDRGHMAPSADFLFSQEANDESFYLTNMTPQTPGLNQRAWSALEGRVRRWACGLGHIKVYTGPLLNGGNLQRLESCVSVPEKFFKVVLADKPGEFKAIGFIYSQSDDHDVWKERAVSVREVEQVTGLKFFTEVPDALADKIKAEYNIEDWEKSEVNCRRCGEHLLPPESSF